MITISQPPSTIVKYADIETGIYTGDGAEDRDIDLGFILESKSNVYVIVKGNVDGVGSEGRSKIEYFQGNLSMFFCGGVDEPNYIQVFTNTGFRVGIGLNAIGVVYRYIVFWEEYC